MSTSLDQLDRTAERRANAAPGLLGALRILSAPALVVVLATIVAAVLRLVDISSQSLWMDEASSLRNAMAFGTGGLLGMARADQVAPLHSMILWLATHLWGSSEASLRMPSALAGIALVPMMYLIGRRLFVSPWIGVVAAAIVAISPYAIWYSQEARMYACLLLCTAIFVYLSWPVLQRPLRAWELVALTVVTTLGYGMHHYMALVVGAFSLFLIVEGKALKRPTLVWAVTQAIAFLVFVGWLYLTRDKLGNQAGTEKPQFLLWIPYTIYTYVVGFSFGPSTREIQLAGGHGLIATLLRYLPDLVMAAVGAGILTLAGVWRALKPDMRTTGKWLLIWLVAPILLAVMATRVSNISYNVRYVITCFPALVFLFSVAIHEAATKLLSARRRENPVADRHAFVTAMPVALASALAIGCMLASTRSHATDSRYAKEDVRAMSRVLNGLPRDAILVADNNNVTKLLPYYHGRVPAVDLQVDYRRPVATPQWVVSNFNHMNPPIGSEVILIEYRSWEADPKSVIRSRLLQVAQPFWSQSLPGVQLTRFRVLSPTMGPAQ